MQIDWWTLALQTVNFLIVVWLLSRFLYQPIRRVIEEREAADRKAAETAEEKVGAAEEARKAFEAKRGELAETQHQEEARLHAEMEKERQAMLADAEKAANDLLSDARSKIERERKQALDDLGEQIVGLARDLARTALGDGAAFDKDALLTRVTAHLDDLPDRDLAELRADLAGDATRLSVITADPLTEPQQARWRGAMTGHFPGAAICFDVEPAILGGVELRFPHAVLSFSVADRLRRATEELKT